MFEGITSRLFWYSHMELDPYRQKEWVHPPLMIWMMTLHGTGTLVVKNGGEYPVDAKEHTLFLLTPQIHRYVISNVDDPLGVFAAGISVEFADGTDFFDRCRPERVLISAPQSEEICATIRELQERLSATDRKSAIEIELLATRLCAAGMRFCVPLPESELPRPIERCRRAVEFLANHFREEPDAELLASMCGMSRTLFFRLFRAETGMTPGEFRLHRRMQEARKLLLQNKLTIAEIANRLGWENPFFFSRVFKRETGLSPRDFRRRQFS